MHEQHRSTATDRVFIEGLEIETVIGVYDWERDIQQRLSFDIEMAWDIRPAAKTDDVALALDYSQVSEKVIAYIKNSSFQLIESLAEQVAQLILLEFNVSMVKIRLRKPGAVPESRSVGVEIVRYAVVSDKAR